MGPAVAGRHGLSDATARVARALLVEGALTAGELASRLLLTGTAVRRHLDTLIEDGYAEANEERPFGPTPRRGRGRPARYYSLTAEGRDAFESSYDDVAVAALRFLSERFGDEAVTEFARQRAAELVRRYSDVRATVGDAERVEVLARRLSEDGFAASATPGPRGLQLCQHHCPVAHVAEEFPQLCEAEREAFAQLLGLHVTRLATIAAGDGVCTTIVPTPTVPSAGDSRPPTRLRGNPHD
ncbi:MAG: MarR family transcriptional regulator [Actinobacteria bacterium]|nr:MarR family transcriptional regulator [Actinomycetota bacterium]MCB9412390.1 MarR family transcriptional regulator [Actinomycetota bacterium]